MNVHDGRPSLFVHAVIFPATNAKATNAKAQTATAADMAVDVYDVQRPSITATTDSRPPKRPMCTGEFVTGEDDFLWPRQQTEENLNTESPDLGVKHVDVVHIESASSSASPTTSVEGNRSSCSISSGSTPNALTMDESLSDLEIICDGKPLLQGSPPTQIALSPENALRLHIDRDERQRCVGRLEELEPPPQAQSTVTCTPLSSLESIPSPTLPSRGPPRVRFRSRVRIAGSHCHRHQQKQKCGRSASFSSTTSSRSESPCSSISVPLRYHPNERSALGPLGQRLNALAANNGWGGRGLRSPALGSRGHGRSKRRRGGEEEGIMTSERTPLLRPSPAYAKRRMYMVGEREEETEEEEDETVAEMDKEADKKFGTWPGRLFNHRWWWWQLEPIVCCLCLLDDPEVDE